jgi:hypothetical protein
MKRWIAPVALLMLMALPMTAFAQGIGLTPEKARSNVEVIKYVTIFIVGSILIFFLLIRLTIIPFLVRNYYSLSDATNIGLSLFILYALNLFTLLFFRYSLSTGWRMVFLVVAMFWMIHLLLKVILARRHNDD